MGVAGSDNLDWGVDSEHARLTDVLLCRPDHYRWLETSDISRATLASGRRFDPAVAAAQHAELVSMLDDQGVTTHFLEPDPALPYQVYTRDSSLMTPAGPIVTQLHQDWRRGEYAAVIRFYEQARIPIRAMVTAAALEGGDYMIIEPGVVLIGHGEERTQRAAAEQVAGWLRDDGWEVRLEPIPPRYVHMDVLVCPLGPKLAAVCEEVVSGGLLRWLRDKGFDTLSVPAKTAFKLGVNVLSLGENRILSSAGAPDLNEQLRAHGFTVLAPDLSSFTLGGGGAHCLTQPLRRERLGE